MKALVFVPGIMGTELLSGTGEKLWPPKPLETQFGYGRVDKLLGEDVRYGGIIENVVCYDVYGSLLAQFVELGFQQNGTDKRLYPFPYDWRLDLEHTAEELARQLDTVDSDGARDIHLVAHSMGGLVSRLVLETGTYANRPWFKKIRTFIAMATPHQGAPLALARVLGLDSTLGISKRDFRKLAADPRYPSGYQLLPAPNEAACWSKADLTVGAVDIYDAGTATRLGLNPQLLTRARFVHESLAHGAVPPDVRYFYFAGTGHETVTRVNVLERNGAYPVDEMVVTRTEDAGDGTVPFWSALPRAVQKQVVVNEHAKVFHGMPFKRVFYRLLGGDLGIPLESLGLEEKVEATRLSIPTPIIHAGREFELLLVPTSPTEKLVGTLWLQRLKEDGMPAATAEEMSTISYEGPRVSRLRVSMPPVSTAGLYELRFTGAPANSDALRFAVVSLRNDEDAADQH
jgi:pimeloyl-ACP methyl ester carboxylesterase